jgi:anaphase-promoting complex subunit 11
MSSSPLSAAAIETEFFSPASSAMEMSPVIDKNIDNNLLTSSNPRQVQKGIIKEGKEKEGDKDKMEMDINDEIKSHTEINESLHRDGLKVKVTSCRFVASWRWTVAETDEVCGICRMPFEDCCPSCKFAGDECPPLVGACKHAYHLHCIHNWLAAKDKEQVCPLCRRTWE